MLTLTDYDNLEFIWILIQTVVCVCKRACTHMCIHVHTRVYNWKFEQ